MEAGVSAYVVKGLTQDRVQPVVDVAVAHFNRYHTMREELERARLSLVERKTVDRAKGLLMEQKGIGEEAAYVAAQARDGPEQAHWRSGAGSPDLCQGAEILIDFVVLSAANDLTERPCTVSSDRVRGLREILRGAQDDRLRMMPVFGDTGAQAGSQ